MALHRPGG